MTIMQKWYWCGQSSNAVNDDEEVIDYGDAAAFFEPTVSDRNIGIKIRNLTKVCTKHLLISLWNANTLMLFSISTEYNYIMNVGLL